MRKITSILLALVFVFALGAPIYAADDPTVGVASATIAAGETANIEVYIENNPGVAGMTLKLAYDKNVLSIGDITKGAVFSSVVKGTVSVGNQLVIDDDHNVTANGTIATLPITVAADAAPGDYEITLTVKTAVNADLQDVVLKTVSAVITVPAPAAPTVGIESATIEAGQTATVAVYIDANPGIAGMTLKLAYDKNVISVGDVTKGTVFSSVVKGNVSVGNQLVIDDDHDVTADGIIAYIPITIAADAAAGDYEITLTVKTAVNSALTDVVLDTVSAVITVTVPTPTVGIENASIVAGQTGSVNVYIENNPGIAGMTLKLAYDKDVISVGDVTKGTVFSSVVKGTVSVGNQLVIDDDHDVTADGIIATLPITVAPGTAAGDYEITLSVKTAVNAALTDVVLDTVSAVITVTEAVIPEITFTAANVTVDAANIESFRDGEGFVVPVAITASDIPAANGVAAFTIKVDGDAEIKAIEPGAAIVDAERFTVGPNNDIVWVDVNDITAADAEIAIVNIYVDHVVAADSVFNVTLASSGDPDDYLLIDLTNYTPVFVNGSVTFEVGADHIAADAVIENAVDPSCTVDGSHDEVVYCSICGAELSRTPVVDTAPGHTPATEAVIENVVEPSCTVDGSHDEVIYCTVCHEEVSRTPVVDTAPGHDLQHFDRVEAQVGVDGNIEYWYCSVCDKYFSDEGVTEIDAADTVIPALTQIPGDVDGDGNINAIDVRIIMKVLAGWTADEDPEVATYDPLIADFNGDGKVNNRDILAMLKWIVANA